MPYDQMMLAKFSKVRFAKGSKGTRKAPTPGALTRKTLGRGSLGTSSKDVHSHDDETLVLSPLAMAMALFLAA